MNKTESGTARLRRLAWFTEREFFMRSNGRVRFVKMTSRLQLAALGFVVLALSAGGFAVVAGWGNAAPRTVSMVRLDPRVVAERARVRSVVADLQRRQAFLEQMSKMLPDDGQVAGEVAARGERAGIATTISFAMPEEQALARIGERQLSLVERMTRYAQRRSATTELAIRKLGLNPSAMVKPAGGMGGPLVHLATEQDGSIDPRFRRLGVTLARMDALERGLAGIPQVMPADISMISSGFGFRSDPFTGDGAMHTGLDFRGPVGAPIHAAAAGRVSFVGERNGYGNVVEISHGHGLLTRYAHMSAFRARLGQPVDAGQVIGLIGSSGRSTGPHLHFEVRINDRAVNPRPFLETAPHVLEEARARA